MSHPPRVMPKNILIVRTDRVGDVLLTTPVSQALKDRFPDARITWLVRPYTAPLLEQNPTVDHVLVDHGGSVSKLVEKLKGGYFDVAIVSLPRWRVSWALFRAGIPVRIGPASKWYSILFTERITQHRSESTKHEADYNLELLAPLGVPFKRGATQLTIAPDEKAAARKLLESHRLTMDKPIIFLHPGSGGSSGRWPLTHFMQLGDALQEAGAQVVITAGPGEEYQNIMIDQMHRIPVFIAGGSVSLRELAALYSCGDVVVSNSTGPLHLAVAAGVPTVSIYSPQVGNHPRRWGPYPAFVENDDKHTVFIAPMVGSNGENQEDMGAVSVAAVREACLTKIKQRLR